MIPPRERANRRRRGVALVMTLGAIAVIGALVAGVLLSSLLERRAAMDEMLRARALDAAELGLASTIAPAAWNPTWSTTPARGTITLHAFALDAPDAVDTIRVTRLSTHALLVISDARVGLSSLAFARRRVSTIVVLDSALRPVPARAHTWLELTR